MSDILAKIDQLVGQAHAKASKAPASSPFSAPPGLKEAVAKLVKLELKVSEKGHPGVLFHMEIVYDNKDTLGIDHAGKKFQVRHYLMKTAMASLEEKLIEFYSDLKRCGFAEQVEAAVKPSQVIGLCQQKLPIMVVFSTSTRTRDDGEPYITLKSPFVPTTASKAPPAKRLTSKAPPIQQELPLSDAEEPEGEEYEEEPAPVPPPQKRPRRRIGKSATIEVDSRVVVTLDGADYEGVIQEVHEDYFVVNFDDGDVCEVDRDMVTLKS